jgi:hypothetical protein
MFSMILWVTDNLLVTYQLRLGIPALPHFPDVFALSNMKKLGTCLLHKHDLHVTQRCAWHITGQAPQKHNNNIFVCSGNLDQQNKEINFSKNGHISKEKKLYEIQGLSGKATPRNLVSMSQWE